MHVDEILATLASVQQRLDDMDERISALKVRLSSIEVRPGTPGRRPKPLLRREAGVCGLDPSCDSSQCAAANVYRFQQGCLGTACVEKNREYYADYRAKRRSG